MCWRETKSRACLGMRRCLSWMHKIISSPKCESNRFVRYKQLVDHFIDAKLHCCDFVSKQLLQLTVRHRNQGRLRPVFTAQVILRGIPTLPTTNFRVMLSEKARNQPKTP
jgi:hypothetical protein